MDSIVYLILSLHCPSFVSSEKFAILLFTRSYQRKMTIMKNAELVEATSWRTPDATRVAHEETKNRGIDKKLRTSGSSRPNQIKFFTDPEFSRSRFDLIKSSAAEQGRKNVTAG